MESISRINLLREKALNADTSFGKFYFAFFSEYLNDKKPQYKNYKISYRKAFESFSPVIDEGELIVGKPDINFEQKAQWEALKEKIVEKDIIPMCGQDSHMTVDLDLVLEKGLLGIISDTEKMLKLETDAEKIAFYDCAIDNLKAVCDFSLSYSSLAKEKALSEENPTRKKELFKIAEACENVPINPARSFYEAVQCVNFICFCVSIHPFRYFSTQQYTLGRPDRYLYKYYVEDIKKGIISPEGAQTFIDCLCIQINNRVHNGLSCGYMLGGRDENGNTIANEITLMGLQAIDNVHLVYPAVGLCYTNDMEPKYLKKACEVLSHGRSHPAIFNDDIISAGLREYGVTQKESVNYIHSTCVEITTIGSSNIWVASPYTNMLQILLDLLDNEYLSYDDLVSDYFKSLDSIIEENCEEQNDFRMLRENKSIFPFLSCLVNDCLEKGIDIEKGGAKYNWIMPSFVGVANVIDSLYIIKKVVFEEKAITLKALNDIIKNNFKGNEALRQKLLNNYPKYGNDVDEVDSLFKVFTNHISDECKKYSTHFNSKLIPSVFCWIMHDILGRNTGASPDGRSSGFPLGDGSGPCQGREKKGPTASVLSSTKWSHKEFIGGVAVNMKFSKKTFTDNSYKNMYDIIKTYMDRGGFEIQINVVDKETLENARTNPEKFRDLVVRIGGYSDYFVKLSPTMQEEVLLRTEHEI